MKDRTSLIQEIYQINFQRLKTAIIVLIPFHLVLIVIDLQRLFSGILVDHTGYRYLYYLHLFLLSMLVMYLVLFARYKEFNSKTLYGTQRKMQISLLILLMTTGAAVASVDQMIHRGIWAYIIVVLAIGAAVYLPGVERLWVFLPAHIIFITGMIIFQDNPDLLWGNLINGSLMLVVGVLLSSFIFKTYCKAHEESTKRKQAEESLRKSEEELKTVIDNMTDVVAMVDVEGKFTYISESNYQLTGYKPSELLGKSIHELILEEDLPIIGDVYKEVVVEGRKDARFEYRIRNKNGNYIWVETIGSLVLDDNGQPSGALFTTRDITERKKAEEQIHYLGFHDQLTGLYNRHYFEKCKEELKDIPVLSVIMTDVNGLKLINDTYGHEAGDELLNKYAELLRNSFKASDLIFRWGGDEFIIILKNTEEAKSWDLCDRLIKHCGATFVRDIPLSISVGISSKSQGEAIDKAIQEAEDMMYKNKLSESKSSKNLIMKTLLKTLSEKSYETKEHLERMGMVGRKIGERLSFSSSELSRLATLTLLHDIGKINLDSQILLKETALTDQEWEEIKKHPEVGYRITRTAEEFACVAEEIFAHHERWDGKGYPQGLQGEDIPYLARLLNIIDSYDVMSNGRPYKEKISLDEIIEEIEKSSGKQFDPNLAEEFVKCLKEGIVTYQYQSQDKGSFAQKVRR